MFRFLAASLAYICCIASTTTATTVAPMDLAQLVELADNAFAGTVASISSHANPARTISVTTVRFVDVVVAKGTLGPEATLTLRGGKSEIGELIVGGQPRFQIGGRYVVLAAADMGSQENQYLPIVGMTQGIYPVTPERGGGPPVVTIWEGLPVVGLSGRRLIVQSQSDPDPDPDPVHRAEVVYLPERARSSAGNSNRKERQQPRSSEPIPPPAAKGRPPVITSPGPDPSPTPRPVERRRIQESAEPLQVRPKSADTGQRVSEAEFLAIIRSLDVTR